MTTKKHVKRALSIVSLVAAVSVNADTAIHNVKGYTSSDNGIVEFTALVFDDTGTIRAVGSDEILERFPDSTRIDANGRTLLPGLIDAHGHVLGLGTLKSNLDLLGITSLAETVDRIQTYAEARPSARWILGRGWNQVIWPIQAFPDASDIDSVVGDRPVWLRRVDGHAGWANSLTLERAGITDETPDPVGGKILRDENGHATGVLIDRAMDLVSSIIPKSSKSETRDAIDVAIDALLSEGITSVHDAGIDLDNAEVYLSMADNDELRLRIYAMIQGVGPVLDAIGKPIRAYGNGYLDIAAVKLYTDGALGSRGAAMIEPYSDDDENRGLPFWTQHELDDMVAKATDMGFQVAIHAIGDLGNRMALDAFENVSADQRALLRNRIEHAQVIAQADISRFAKLNVIASMQATHATSDMNMAEDRVGRDRIHGAYAWRRLLQSGAVLANGSDFPVELSNPFHGLYATITRKDRQGQPGDGWYSEQALTRAEALHSFTLAAAYAAHQERKLGSLEVGKAADFIVVDRDYFSVDEAEIDDIVVLQTWVAGELVFSGGEL